MSMSACGLTGSSITAELADCSETPGQPRAHMVTTQGCPLARQCVMFACALAVQELLEQVLLGLNSGVVTS